MISQLLIALHGHSEIADNARRDLQQGIESVALFSSHTHTHKHTPPRMSHIFLLLVITHISLLQADANI